MNAVLSAILCWLIFFFFTGIEVAFLSANKLVIDLQEKQGFWSGRGLLFLVKHPAWFFCTTLIGQLLSLLFVSLFLIRWASPSFAAANLFVAILLSVATLGAIVVATRLLARASLSARPNRVLDILIYPFAVFYILLMPLTFCLISLGKRVTKLVQGIPFPNLTQLFAPPRYWYSVTETPAPEFQSVDNKILRNALDFKNVKVRECMIPRNEIVAMDVQEGIAKLHNLFIQSGHSKIILYRENVDNIVGYCNSSALFRHPQTVNEILTPIITIPETTPASELLTRFIEERKKIAVVMDEFGGTAGLVSMEDVIEEIFGDIEDEYDIDEFTEHAIDANTFLFSGRLEIDYLNETYALNLPQGDYDTLGGLILSLTEDLPKSGEIVTLPNFTLTIQSTVKNRIGVVRLTRQVPPPDEEENGDKNT